MSSILTYPRSVSIEFAMFGNWIFTATFAGVPVGDACPASTAECTCPMDAAAKGRRSNDSKYSCQEGPSELRRTSWVEVRRGIQCSEKERPTSICQSGM